MLLVDLSYQVYRAAASHPGLCDAERRFTGGLYGFMAAVAKAIRDTGATRAVACLDSKPYVRSRDYPEYKQLRKRNQDNELLELYRASEPLVLDLLDQVGIPTWAAPGFESDDLIAHAVRRHRSRFDRVWAASNDSDLYQLLDCPTFAVYRDSLTTAVTAATLLEKHGLTPAEFALATALQGTHNDIAGIAGVGPKRAAAAVRDAAAMRRLRGSHGALIDRNAALIALPHPEFPAALPLPAAGAFSARRLYRWSDGYDIDCTLSMVNAFDQLNH